jgi:hypothetical protein
MNDIEITQFIEHIKNTPRTFQPAINTIKEMESKKDTQHAIESTLVLSFMLEYNKMALEFLDRLKSDRNACELAYLIYQRMLKDKNIPMDIGGEPPLRAVHYEFIHCITGEDPTLRNLCQLYVKHARQVKVCAFFPFLGGTLEFVIVCLALTASAPISAVLLPAILGGAFLVAGIAFLMYAHVTLQKQENLKEHLDFAQEFNQKEFKNARYEGKDEYGYINPALPYEAADLRNRFFKVGDDSIYAAVVKEIEKQAAPQ